MTRTLLTDAATLITPVRRAIADVLPGIPTFDVQRMETRVAAATAPNRPNATPGGRS